MPFDDSAEHASVTCPGAPAPVQVTNVRAATSTASLDAVNGAQLACETNQAVARNTDGITNLGQRVTDNATAEYHPPRRAHHDDRRECRRPHRERQITTER